MKNKKALLVKLIEREEEYCDSCEIGSEEYVKSLERLTKLREQLDAQRDQKGRLVVEGVKVAGGIVLPVIGWVVITAFEREDTLTTSLKKTVDCFLPKRL